MFLLSWATCIAAAVTSSSYPKSTTAMCTYIPLFTYRRSSNGRVWSDGPSPARIPKAPPESFLGMDIARRVEKSDEEISPSRSLPRVLSRRRTTLLAALFVSPFATLPASKYINVYRPVHEVRANRRRRRRLCDENKPALFPKRKRYAELRAST